LALAKSIAEDMSGRITVVSKPGEGSVFTLWLRVA
jgi:signal transduction histidine kinase